MGMAASQARFLGLTARKTNTEYEGQQVNQQRTALANQSAGLFNQMLGLEVPTPPLATNYQKTEYVFTDPSTSEKIYLDSIYKNPTLPGGSESYTVSGYSKSSSVISNISTIVGSGNTNNRYEILPDEKDKSKYTISVNGGTRMSIVEPKKYNALTQYFIEAEKASGNTDESTYPKENDLYFKYTNPNTQVEYYIPAGTVENPMTTEDLAKAAAEGQNFKVYSAEGYTKDQTFHYDDAKMVNANDGTGRYDAITFYTDTQRDPITGEPKEGETPITCKLTQQTVQDDASFDAAMETYNAKKIIYDKTVSDIDSKTAIIQQQDRTLELHLDQLDTEQQAIQTEMDAVKKVIDKNIEETFKTFA